MNDMIETQEKFLYSHYMMKSYDVCSFKKLQKKKWNQKVKQEKSRKSRAKGIELPPQVLALKN